MYTLKKFGAVDLPTRMPTDDMGSGGDAKTAPYVLSSGGAYDMLGTDEAFFAARKLTKSGRYYATTAAARETYLRSLYAMLGKSDKLYREWEDTTLEWVQARLVNIAADRSVENRQHIDITTTFEVYSPYWRGALVGAWFLDNGEYFDTGLYLDSGNEVTIDSSPKAITETRTGSAIVMDTKFIITAGSAAITALTIACADNGWEMTYTGTIAIGKMLIIDCGGCYVLNDNADDYAHFALTSNHTINEWSRLIQGDNDITVTITGGSTDSTISLNYYEGWK